MHFLVGGNEFSYLIFFQNFGMQFYANFGMVSITVRNRCIAAYFFGKGNLRGAKASFISIRIRSIYLQFVHSFEINDAARFVRIRHYHVTLVSLH